MAAIVIVKISWNRTNFANYLFQRLCHHITNNMDTLPWFLVDSRIFYVVPKCQTLLTQPDSTDVNGTWPCTC